MFHFNPFFKSLVQACIHTTIEGALKVFGEKGFEATTIAAISKAANISEATLYEYFSSKEDVLFAIPNLYTRRELEKIKEIAHYIVRNMVMGFIEHLTIQWVLVGRPESISHYRDTIFDMVIRAIEKKGDTETIDLKITGNNLKIQAT